ncbi:hypothetical protein WN944_017485 [Citrus x changshan-huyou]|uniref:Uncharacterized protein n=1 Tax=Citrus x changshan-huyou TaxID=2935761 RepID=A0AAP0MHQ7_9ROSI
MARKVTSNEHELQNVVVFACSVSTSASGQVQRPRFFIKLGSKQKSTSKLLPMAVDYTKTQCIVLLIDLNPRLHLQDQELYIITVLAAVP